MPPMAAPSSNAVEAASGTDCGAPIVMSSITNWEPDPVGARGLGVPRK